MSCNTIQIVRFLVFNIAEEDHNERLKIGAKEKKRVAGSKTEKKG